MQYERTANQPDPKSPEPTRRKTRIPGILPTLPELTFGAALGCNNAWVNMCFMNMGIFAQYSYGENLLDIVYLISIVSITLTLLGSAAFDKKVAHILNTKVALYGLPIGMCVSTAVMPLSGFDGPAGVAAIFAAGVLSGFFSGLFLVRLGLSFSTLTMHSIVIGSASGFMLAMLLFAVSLLFQPLESCLFAASMPLAASIFLQWSMKEMPSAEEDSSSPESIPQALDDASEKRSWNRLIMRLSLCALLVGFANEATRTLYVQMGIANGGGYAYSFLQAVVALVATIGIIAITLALANSQGENMVRNCHNTIFIVLVLGVLLLPFPQLQTSASVSLPYAVNAAAWQLFGMFMWIILTGICGRTPYSRVRTFSLVRAAWAAGPLLGLHLGRFVLHTSGLTLDALFSVMLISVLAMLVAGNVAFTETDALKAMDAIPLARKQRFRAKCSKVIERYGLSEREGEIMVMFAKGRNLPYVQENLYLSKSTVSTHRQHIYQKLDIHSQQELIDLVQNIDN